MPLTSSQSTAQATGSRAEASAPARVVLLDNRDSFVYNLVDQFATLGSQIEVYRNNVPASRVLAALEPTEAEKAAGQRPLLITSPGPGHPREAGCLMELTAYALEQRIPTLGICLGYQALVEACGGQVAPVGPTHGRTDRVLVTKAGAEFAPLAPCVIAPRSGEQAPYGWIDVARYHSLGSRELPAQLVSLAHSRDDVVMALSHASDPAVGLQFHPESILPPDGPPLIRALFPFLTKEE